MEIEKFAHQITEFLDHGRKQNQYEHLVIFADPRFYGLMGLHMTKYVKDMIKKVVHKDFMHLNDNELLDEVTKK